MVSTKLFSAFLATLVVLSIVGTNVASVQAQASSTVTSPTLTLAQVLANNTNLTNFTSLLKKANLTNVLTLPGNFTVLAPDDSAFSKVDAATLATWQNNTTVLAEMLKYHIIPERLPSTAFVGNGTLQTYGPYRVPYSVDGTKIKIDNATIIKKDINATNGVLHIIDNVMIPPTNASAAASASALGGFLGLPGFEAIYAVAGLLAVAYLVMRRRK